MGIDYSYDIYVRRRDAGQFLAAVTELCDPRGDEPTTIELPDGTSVEIPCTYGFKSGCTVRLADLTADNATDLDLAPLFVEDGPLSGYRKESGDEFVLRVGSDGTRRVHVAYTYLGVHDASRVIPDHLDFRFTPATSAQSRLFLSSPSIRETFASLALRVGAPLCLLDVEERHEIVVAAHGRRLSTQVPGPCVLWNTHAYRHEVYRHLLAWLDGQPPHRSHIIGPEHADYPGFLASLVEHSRVTTAVT